MKELLGLLAIVMLVLFLASYCESKRNPYEEGMHLDYSIKCENGFVYKSLSQRRGTIQIFNSDGTPLKCGKEIY